MHIMDTSKVFIFMINIHFYNYTIHTFIIINTFIYLKDVIQIMNILKKREKMKKKKFKMKDILDHRHMKDFILKMKVLQSSPG